MSGVSRALAGRRSSARTISGPFFLYAPYCALSCSICAMKRTILAACLAVAVPALALAQAQTSLSSLRVGYTTRKNTVKPQGELKAQIDDIDRQIADATRQGRTGEIRRLIAKGTTLLNGRAWTPELDFTTSVVIRTQTVVADSSRPLAFRLEQIYAPDIAIERPLTAH